MGKDPAHQISSGGWVMLLVWVAAKELKLSYHNGYI